MDKFQKLPVAKADRIDTAQKALKFIAEEGLTLEVRREEYFGGASRQLLVYNLSEPIESRFRATYSLSPGMMDEIRVVEISVCRVLEIYREKHPKAGGGEDGKP